MRHVVEQGIGLGLLLILVIGLFGSLSPGAQTGAAFAKPARGAKTEGKADLMPQAPFGSAASQAGPLRRVSYLYGATPLARLDGALQFVHGDHVGTGAAWTDAAGRLSEASRQLPFGAQVGAVGRETDFAGKKVDGATALDDFGARPYHPAVGRFGAADPAGAPDGSLYAYGLNSPLTRIDAEGRIAVAAPAVAPAYFVGAVAAAGALGIYTLHQTGSLDAATEAAGDVLDGAWDLAARGWKQVAQHLPGRSTPPLPPPLAQPLSEDAARPHAMLQDQAAARAKPDLKVMPNVKEETRTRRDGWVTVFAVVRTDSWVFDPYKQGWSESIQVAMAYRKMVDQAGRMGASEIPGLSNPISGEGLFDSRTYREYRDRRPAYLYRYTLKRADLQIFFNNEPSGVCTAERCYFFNPTRLTRVMPVDRGFGRK